MVFFPPLLFPEYSLAFWRRKSHGGSSEVQYAFVCTSIQRKKEEQGQTVTDRKPDKKTNRKTETDKQRARIEWEGEAKGQREKNSFIVYK